MEKGVRGVRGVRRALGEGGLRWGVRDDARVCVLVGRGVVRLPVRVVAIGGATEAAGEREGARGAARGFSCGCAVGDRPVGGAGDGEWLEASRRRGDGAGGKRSGGATVGV